MSEQYKDWLPGRKVRCIDNGHFRNRLSVGMIYEITEAPQTIEDKTYIAVTTNNGVPGKYSIFRFELLPLETPLTEEQRPESKVLKHGDTVVIADHTPTYKELQQQLKEAQDKIEELTTKLDSNVERYKEALRQVDIAFQDGYEEGAKAILPNFAPLGSDKFKAIPKLAKAYKNARKHIDEELRPILDKIGEALGLGGSFSFITLPERVTELKQELQASQEARKRLDVIAVHRKDQLQLCENQLKDCNALIERQRLAIEKLQDAPKGEEHYAATTKYTPKYPHDWILGKPCPSTVQEALDRIAYALNQNPDRKP